MRDYADLIRRYNGKTMEPIDENNGRKLYKRQKTRRDPLDFVPED